MQQSNGPITCMVQLTKNRLESREKGKHTGIHGIANIEEHADLFLHCKALGKCSNETVVYQNKLKKYKTQI